jgi:hypothetical protein
MNALDGLKSSLKKGGAPEMGPEIRVALTRAILSTRSLGYTSLVASNAFKHVDQSQLCLTLVSIKPCTEK